MIVEIPSIYILNYTCYNKFVILMRFSQSISKNLIENLENISDCIDIIFYYKDKIDKINIEVLK